MACPQLFRFAPPVCTFALLFGMACPADAAGLSKRQISSIENGVLPAYYRGDTLGTLKSLSQVVGKMSDEQVAELDDLLAGQNVPPSGELLVRARLKLLQRNARQRLPNPTLREQLVALAHIKSELESLLDEAANHPIMGDDLPGAESLDDYERTLWDAHVIGQRLLTSTALARYAADALKTKRRFRVKSLSDDQRGLLETDFAALEARLGAARHMLDEREIEVRIERLKQANNVLRDSQDIKNRFIAAWSVDLDGDLILEALAEGPFQTEALNDESLADEVGQLVGEGRELAGDLLEKSRLLYTGLHWWFRGRYGMGTDGFGLLKSPMALQSADEQFGLYMPIETPKPTDPSNSNGYGIPEIDRRHHYIWAWEYRQASFSRDTSKQSSTTRRVTEETRLSRFY